MLVSKVARVNAKIVVLNKLTCTGQWGPVAGIFLGLLGPFYLAFAENKLEPTSNTFPLVPSVSLRRDTSIDEEGIARTSNEVSVAQDHTRATPPRLSTPEPLHTRITTV
jgi:hypothetical protein